ncbi:MAG: NAD(P)H-hydrate dehydratase [Candidatus Koribacter versatilis]|uniref:Bifunctional NAD(P)H-hydrate repair enzyme n=1 Tax=Candidatus Korobacter versatilis TaxID=658062 RepID=A0A932A885_9BACT|nr:NAD(P)H-hydrate dehydratase [Candidatus Koribacter versatilis]
MKIVTAAEMRQIDRATSERFGVPSTTLMENAGAAVAEFVLAHWAATRKIAVVCGKGNNGGDGLVVARKLSQAGKQVVVLLLAKLTELKGDAAEMLEQCPVEPVVVTTESELHEAVDDRFFDCDLIVDALLGTGFRPPMSPLYAEAIAAMNIAKAPIVAVDIPSGADADSRRPPEESGKPVARADAIVTFTAPRPAHVFGRLTDGPTVVAPIGTPAEVVASESRSELNLITPADFEALLAPRSPDSHKGDYGHVLVIGGSTGKAGAAAMAGMGALRAGAGLVTVATPRSVQRTVAGFAAELMTEPLDETESGGISMKALEHAKKLCEAKSVLAIGPGLGRDAETVEFVRALVKSAKLPVILDADALNAFAGAVGELDGSKRPLVFTPHPGEFARLIGKDTAAVAAGAVALASTFAKERRCVLVLKGHRTVIATPEHGVWVNATGNAGMAKGGSGDVLTGMIAGLSSSSKKCSGETAGAAAYLHGLAGDIAREEIGDRAMLASDILASIGEAFRRAAEQAGDATVTINP